MTSLQLSRYDQTLQSSECERTVLLVTAAHCAEQLGSGSALVIQLPAKCERFIGARSDSFCATVLVAGSAARFVRRCSLAAQLVVRTLKNNNKKE